MRRSVIARSTASNDAEAERTGGVSLRVAAEVATVTIGFATGGAGAGLVGWTGGTVVAIGGAGRA